MSNQNHTQDLKKLIEDQGELIKKMSYQLRKVHQAVQDLMNPNYRRSLAEFAGFDWASIGAVVTKQDADGPAEIQCGHFRYTRRNGSGKFGKAIWFSRCVGQNEQGKLYVRLITFKDTSEAEEVDGKVAQALPEPDPASSVTQKPAPQKPATKARPKRPVAQMPVVGPTTPAQATPGQQTEDPRIAFSRLGAQAVKDKMITPHQFNELTKVARAQDYGAALVQLQQCLS